MNASVFSILNISKQFEQINTFTTVLQNISVTFIQGSTYAIMGASGSGKSTFMHILAGLEIPTSGYILFDNKRLDTLSPAQRAIFLNKSVGLLFQNPYLIRELTVIENVMIPALIAGIKKAEAQTRAYILLERVGLSEKQNAMPGSLSGGQQQRVALARALCNQPAFLLADEPTGNLDEQTAAVIIALLRECQELWGIGLVISTHDKHVAAAMQKIYRLHNGMLTAD